MSDSGSAGLSTVNAARSRISPDKPGSNPRKETKANAMVPQCPSLRAAVRDRRRAGGSKFHDVIAYRQNNNRQRISANLSHFLSSISIAMSRSSTKHCATIRSLLVALDRPSQGVPPPTWTHLTALPSVRRPSSSDASAYPG
jgi:hypothetical protein